MAESHVYEVELRGTCLPVSPTDNSQDAVTAGVPLQSFSTMGTPHVALPEPHPVSSSPHTLVSLLKHTSFHKNGIDLNKILQNDSIGVMLT